jgi:magnesium-transporting ATPase (P-type)
MTWTDIWAGADFEFENPGGKLTELLNHQKFLKNETVFRLVQQGVCCNTIGTTEDAGATEMAMLKFITRCGVDYEKIRKNHLPVQMTRFLFDSSRKRMSTILDLN